MDSDCIHPNVYVALKRLYEVSPFEKPPEDVDRILYTSLMKEDYIDIANKFGGGLLYYLTTKALNAMSAYEVRASEGARHINEKEEERSSNDKKDQLRNRNESFRFWFGIAWGLISMVGAYILSVFGQADTPFRRWLLTVFHQAGATRP